MTTIKITQVKSGIDRPERQKKTLRALGLNKMNASREVVATAQILGMVRTVSHLIRVEETAGEIEAVATHPEVMESKAVPAEVPAKLQEPEAPATEVPATEE